MDMLEYRRAVQKGDWIFLGGGLLFLGNLLAVLANPFFMALLPAGIVVMGYGSHIQYMANEALKHEILMAISSSVIQPSEGVAAALGGDMPEAKCPNCGFENEKQ